MRRKLTALVTVFSALASTAHAKCNASDPRLKEQFTSIRAKWDALDKTLKATKHTGKIVGHGKCAATLLRIGAPAPFALAPHESVKEAHEAISCLALEKWQLQQECECGDRKLNFSRDEASEKATMQAYKDVQALRAKAAKIAIRNKAIKSLVDRADEIKSCFDMNTVKLLHDIERDLQLLIK